MADLNDNRRRVARILVDPKALASLLIEGGGQRFELDPPVPDLEIIAVRDASPWQPQIELLCRSSAFAVVPKYEVAPEIKLSYYRVSESTPA